MPADGNRTINLHHLKNISTVGYVRSIHRSCISSQNADTESTLEDPDDLDDLDRDLPSVWDVMT